MSKKKFDPDKINSFPIKAEFIDHSKSLSFQKLMKGNIFGDFEETLRKNTFYKCLYLLNARSQKMYKKRLGVLVRKYTIENPELKLYGFLAHILLFFEKEYPEDALKEYILSSQGWKDSDDPELKKFSNVEGIYWYDILFYMKNFFFIKKAFEYYSYNSVNDFFDKFLDKIDKYFAVKERTLELFVNYKSTELSEANWKHFENEYKTPLTKLFLELKRIIFNDNFTEQDFENLLLYYQTYCLELKKYDFENESLAQLQDFIVVKGNSKRAKFLILHDILRIFYPHNFTSPGEWAKIRKCSPYTKRNNLSKQAYDSRINEVKRMIPL